MEAALIMVTCREEIDELYLEGPRRDEPRRIRSPGCLSSIYSEDTAGGELRLAGAGGVTAVAGRCRGRDSGGARIGGGLTWRLGGAGMAPAVGTIA